MKRKKLIAGLMLLLTPLTLSACSQNKQMTKAEMQESVVKASKNIHNGSISEGLKMNLIGIPINMKISGDFNVKPLKMAGRLSAYTPKGRKNGSAPFIIEGNTAKIRKGNTWKTSKVSDFSAKDYKKPLNLIDQENFRKSAKYKQENGLVHMNMNLNEKQRKEVLKDLEKTAQDKETKAIYKQMNIDKAQVTETVDPNSNTIKDVKEKLKMSSLGLSYDVNVHLNNVNKVSKVEAK